MGEPNLADHRRPQERDPVDPPVADADDRERGEEASEPSDREHEVGQSGRKRRERCRDRSCRWRPQRLRDTGSRPCDKRLRLRVELVVEVPREWTFTIATVNIEQATANGTSAKRTIGRTRRRTCLRPTARGPVEPPSSSSRQCSSGKPAVRRRSPTPWPHGCMWGAAAVLAHRLVRFGRLARASASCPRHAVASRT